MADTPQERTNEPWAHLSTLPVTNWKAVSGTFLIWIVAIFMMGLIISLKNTQHENLISSLVDSLLFFVGVAAGILPATMFATKRLTFKPGGPDDKRADTVNAATVKNEGLDVSPSSASAVSSQPSDDADESETVIVPLLRKVSQRGD